MVFFFVSKRNRQKIVVPFRIPFVGYHCVCHCLFYRVSLSPISKMVRNDINLLYDGPHHLTFSFVFNSFFFIFILWFFLFLFLTKFLSCLAANKSKKNVNFSFANFCLADPRTFFINFLNGRTSVKNSYRYIYLLHMLNQLWCTLAKYTHAHPLYTTTYIHYTHTYTYKTHTHAQAHIDERIVIKLWTGTTPPP